ncbi:hypothetical protein [Chryseolinea soli]|uniref:Uncharacterized protein n=1 Tax=Chryseolinea soli TaxID=2321403 RepID=A0A385SVL2_9BACT|nr:hypothetical protein [Chryseolinea soli]AYB34197.1 hypothetical protein D4L85_28050 [Chryseolinea soli]
MKKYSMYLWVALIVISMPVTLKAQMGMGKIEEIEAVKGRKLIVMIEEPRERILKRIEKKPKLGSVEDYKADLAKYNANIKEVVEKFWPYDKTGIQYKTFDEIRALAKTKTTEYAVLACISMKASNYHSGYVLNNGLHWVKDIKEDFEDRNDKMFTSILVNTIEDFGGAPVYHTPLFDVFPSKAGLVYGVRAIEGYFTMRIKNKKDGEKRRDLNEQAMAAMAARAPQIANKTLIVRSEWLDEDLTESNIKNVYPYPYKVVDREEMDRIVMKQDAKYAYAVVLPYVVSSSHTNFVLYFHYIMDAADSQSSAFVKPSQGAAMGAAYSGKAGHTNFTEKIFTKMTEQIQGKK